MVFRIAFLVMSACAVFAADGSVAYVDSFDLSGATCGFGKRLLPLKSVDGHALTVSSNVYVRGFGTHPESAIMFRANGFTAVALVNRYPFAREIEVSFAELGLDGQCWVKDLWRQECEGKHVGFYFATVPAHATKLVKMRSVDCAKCD
ncbi:MAG: hypothetical protein J5727_05790 [Kiritimatiellae bacterium]|nr:hypothetical protein [Kiritimatiellia bacterium]